MMNIRFLLLCIGMIFSSNLSAENVSFYLLANTNNAPKMHFDQKQQDDGTWNVHVFEKRPVGFYEQIVGSKKTALNVCKGAAVTTVVSFVAALCLVPKDLDAEAPAAGAALLCMFGGLAVTAISPLVAWEYSNKIKRYEKEYVAKDAQGKPLDEKYEYFRYGAYTGVKEPVALASTVTTVPFVKPAPVISKPEVAAAQPTTSVAVATK